MEYVWCESDEAQHGITGAVGGEIPNRVLYHSVDQIVLILNVTAPNICRYQRRMAEKRDCKREYGIGIVFLGDKLWYM